MVYILAYLVDKMKMKMNTLVVMSKEVLLMLIFVTLLMVGVATRNVFLIILSVVLIIIALGAIESDRGVKDTTYVINGRRILARKFLKVQPEKEIGAGGLPFWGLGSLLMLFIGGIIFLGLASIPILIIAVIIRIFVNSWILSIIAAVSLAVLGVIVLYFRLR